MPRRGRNDQGTPRDILRTLAGGEALTSYELGKRLGKQPGALAKTLARLEREELVEVSTSEGRRTYALTEAAGESLDRSEPAGVLTDDLQLLIVRDQGTAPPVAALAAAAREASVRWTVRLDGALTWIVAVEASDLVATDRLRLAFDRAGTPCVSGRVSALLTAPQLAEFAQAISAPPAELER